MFQSYFSLAFRNLTKHPFHAFINIFGLSIGILFTLLIGSYVYNELRVNKGLKNSSRQYFLASNWKDRNIGVDITTLGPLAKRLKEDFPHLVANYYRWDGITSVVSKGDKHFRQGIQLGDSTLLQMYGFDLLHGNKQTALVQPFSAVITKETAIKYFGKTDVVGETVSIQSFSGTKHDFAITGVLKDLPENSVTQFNNENHNEFFIPTNTFSFFGRADFEAWTNIWLPSYIELQPGVSQQALEAPIRQLIANNTQSFIQENLTIKILPLTDYYLERDNNLVKNMLYTLSFVGLFILLMAVVNFINLSIGSSSRRLKETGMRKVMGGLKKQILFQYLIESIIIVSIATIAGMALYPVGKPLFENIIGKNLPSLLSFPVYFVFIPLVFMILLGLIAGLYPAIKLASINSIDSLKGKLSTVKENILLRKSLVGFQFTIATIVLIAAFIVSKQVTYFFSQNLGYNKDYIVSAQVPRDWTPAGVRKMETIRNEFATIPQVSEVTLSYEIPNGMNGGQPSIYKNGSDSTTAIASQAMVTDFNYLNTYQIKLKAGSFFRNNEADSSKIVLNEKGVQTLGWSNAGEAIGQQIKIAGSPIVLTVQGVTSNFHFNTMKQEIAPIIFFQPRLVNSFRFLSFKLKPGNIGASIDAIQRKWAVLLPGSSFEYTFMDDALKKIYASELQLKKASQTATVLALIIALLGVLGLLSLSIQKRTKEIGIRKVLGASATGIIGLFLKEFLPVLAIGGIISIPIAWNVLNKWLDNYVYRIEMDWVPFVLPVILLGVITTVVIVLKIMRAAALNPVKSLRIE